MTADPRCGSTGGYQAHADNDTPACQPCLDAHAYWQRDYRKRLYLSGGPLTVDATGTRRRLQALARVGWSQSDLAARLGVSQQNVYDFTTRQRVRGSTAAKVCALYDELSMLPGPSKKCAAIAASKGWPPPLAYDDATIDDPAALPATAVDSDEVDELAVDAVLDGHRLSLTGATARAAVHALADRGYPPPLIALRCGLSERQVHRLRARDTAPRHKTNNYLGETA